MPPTLIDLKERLRELFKRFEQRELLAEREELLVENANLRHELTEAQEKLKKRWSKNKLPWLTPDHLDKSRGNYVVFQEDGEFWIEQENTVTPETIDCFLRLR